MNLWRKPEVFSDLCALSYIFFFTKANRWFLDFKFTDLYLFTEKKHSFGSPNISIYWKVGAEVFGLLYILHMGDTSIYGWTNHKSMKEVKKNLAPAKVAAPAVLGCVSCEIVVP